MKKVYCDRCGKEVEQNGNILLRKTMGGNTIADYFDICDKCRESFVGWLNNKSAEQEKPAQNPAQNSAQEPAKKMSPTWGTIKHLAAIFGLSERRMTRILAQTGASRRKAKNGAHWWYEYHITQETYDYLTSKLS